MTSTQPATPRAHKRLFLAVLITQTLLIGLILCEGVTRLLLPVRDPYMHPWPSGYFVTAPTCGYHQVPNYPKTWMKHADGKTANLCYSNALGMRDRPVPPPDGKSLRILVAGSSQSEGMAVTDPMQPWPRQLELQLNHQVNRTDVPVQVMNGAVAGYNTFQMLARTIELHPRIKPDVWLIDYYATMWTRNLYGAKGQFALHWNNIYNEEIYEQIFGNCSAPSRWLVNHSMLWRRLVYLAHHRGDINRNVVQRAFTDPEAATRDVFVRFREAARQRGVIPVVVYIPELTDLDQHPGAMRDTIGPQIEKLAKDAGLLFLDPTPLQCVAKRAVSPQGKFFDLWACSEHDPHYNPAGNATYAASLATLLAPRLQEFKQTTTARQTPAPRM